ncbi:MAG: multiple antibiotic resistance protein [Candidatus Azotimanducaceae bacterium]
MDTSVIISAAMILFLFMDPLGNIPLLLLVLKNVEPRRGIKVTFQELIIAQVAPLIYLFFGRYILGVPALSNESIAILGGIIVFLIAIRRIFQTTHGISGETED